MAEPTKYTPGYDFSNFQANNPDQPMPGQRLDIEFHDIEASIGEAIDALSDIRRADGKLQNGIVDADALAAGLLPSVTALAEIRDEAEAAATLAEASAVLTAADRVATGEDRAATAADRVATGEDAAATAADRVATGEDRAATGEDALATAADRVATGEDRAATAADRAAAEAAAAAAEVAKIEWRGAWATGTAYAARDAVERNGSSYVVRSPHTSGPTSEPGAGASWTTFWDLLAARGAQGDPGPAGSGSGDVNGPAGAVNNRIAVFDGGTGKLLKDGGVAVDGLAPASVVQEARKAGALSFPTGFEDDGRYWVQNSGNPLTLPEPTDWTFGAGPNGVKMATYAVSGSVIRYLMRRAVVDISGVGRRYRASARVRARGGVPNNLSVYFTTRRMDAAFNYVSANSFDIRTSLVADQFVTVSRVFTTIDNGGATPFGFVGLLVNPANAGAMTHLDVEEIVIEELNAGDTQNFASVANVLANTEIGYPGRQEANVGGLIHAVAEGVTYRIAASAATDHHVVTAGGLKLYVLPDSAGYDARAFGIVGDGVVDNAPLILNAATRLSASGQAWVLNFPPGDFRVADEIDLRSITPYFELVGVRESTRFIPDLFGASKAVFLPPERRAYAIKGITFVGLVSGDKRTPIAIKANRVSRGTLRDIRSSGYGNTIIWASAAFNCDWANFDLFFSGYQPIHKEVASSIRLTLTAGSTTAVASASVFASSDVNRIICIQAFNPGQPIKGIFRRITGFTNGTTVTLDQPAAASVSSAIFSFTPVRGNISAGAVRLVAQAGIFDNDDIGRFVYIPGAGPDGGVLTATIVNRVSSTQVDLSVAASTSVTDRQIYFTPAIYMGPSDQSETPINDVVISDALIEGYRGPAIITERGTHVFFNNLKTHGRSWGNNATSNFGYSGHSMIWSGTLRGGIDTWESEYAACDLGRGSIAIIGDNPNLTISGMTASGVGIGSPFFTFTPTIPDESGLILKGITGRVDWTEVGGLLHTNTFSQKNRVRGHDIFAASTQSEASNQLASLVGATRSITPVELATGQSFTFTPASDAGLLFVTARDTNTFAGMIAYRCRTTDAGTTIIAGGSNLFTSGTSGLVVTANAGTPSGTVTLTNFSGLRTFHLAILG